MDFFQRVWQVESSGETSVKFALFERLFDDFKSGVFEDFSSRKSHAKSLTTPSYAAFCKVVELKDFSQKTSLLNPAKASHPKLKLASLLHSVAHIEFSAIDLGLDAAYRFDGLPREFYAEWLKVAEDEIRHFQMLNFLLEKMGFCYGEFAVHNGLFAALQKTQHSLIERLALIPRYMEANGLESNAMMQTKLAASGEEEVLAALGVIFDEEISHVGAGSKWFKFACEKEGVSCDEWFDIVKRHFPNAFKNTRELCEEARLRAGFSPREIAQMRGLTKC